jgi:lipid A 3-O-deacylase
MLHYPKIAIPSFSAVSILLILLLCPTNNAAAASADDTGPVCTLNSENDLFGGNSDRHYTQGISINCLTKPVALLTDVAAIIPWFNADEVRKNPAQSRASLTMGQNMYSPTNISEKQIIRDDRPYAGWLYMGFGVVANQGSNGYAKIELDLGVIGPHSYAGDVQRTWHRTFNFKTPNGWDNQLKDEPGLVIFYEQAQRFGRKDILFGLDYDAIFHYGGTLGNVYTYANTGLTFRVGSDLEKDFGPPRIRPSLPGSGYFVGDKGFNWYIFAGTEGRAVLRNIFLDGNSFQDGPRVKKNYFVADFQAGLALQISRFRLTFTEVFRTKEFAKQDKMDQFGSVSLSVMF